jgi:hypothetical protein
VTDDQIGYGTLKPPSLLFERVPGGSVPPPDQAAKRRRRQSATQTATQLAETVPKASDALLPEAPGGSRVEIPRQGSDI